MPRPSSLGEQARQPVTVDDFPNIRIRGEDYVDQSLLYSKTRCSWIYNHCMGLVNVKFNIYVRPRQPLLSLSPESSVVYLGLLLSHAKNHVLR